MRPPARALLLGGLLVVTALGATSASPATATPLERAVSWLASQQREDGSFGSDEAGDVAAANVIEAVAALGLDPGAWPTRERSALAELSREARDQRCLPEVAVRALHASGASGREQPAAVAALKAAHHDGTFGSLASPACDAFAILALHAAGVDATRDPVVQSVADHLANARSAQGGWGFAYPPTTAADVDTTASVLAALAAAGKDVRGDARALLFLNATHATGGGHAQGVTLGNGANTQSTAWALHAYHLLGVAPPADDLPWLLAQQLESGAFRHDPANGANAWATAEAIVLLAGAHYPLPGIVPIAFDADAHALAPVTLALPDAYASARWNVPEVGALTGRAVTVTFPHPGAYGIELDAQGPHATYRGTVTLHVRSARPVVVAPADVDALRHVPVALDLAGSFDPDGTLAGAPLVDWGDGNVTSDGAPHAYDLPGDRVARVRVVDDAGEWSDAALVRVHVRDRAPLFDALPGRIVADRAHEVAIAPVAIDPDGDAVDVAWAWNATAGHGAFRARPTQLGESLVNFTASDPFGASATATVTLDVRNLPPTLANVTIPSNATANVTLRLRAEAADEDGPTPEVAWHMGNGTQLSGAVAEIALAAGTYDVTVEARDADGGVARAGGTILVRDGGAGVISPGAHTPGDIDPAPAPGPAPAPSPSPPQAERAPLPPLAFEVAPAVVRVGEPARFVLVPLAEASVYRFAFGDGSADQAGNETVASHAWTRAGAFEVRATARAADGRESVATLVVDVRSAVTSNASAANAALERASLNASKAPRVTASEALPPGGSAPRAPPLAGAARRETPALLPLAPLLLAALGARRARTARTARR